jgi:hypothetical protein
MIKILNYIDKNLKRTYGHYLWCWIAPFNYKDIEHNNVNKYHSILKFFQFTIGYKDIFILIKSDTREFFGTKKYIVFEDYVLLELFEWEEVLFSEIVEYK